MTKKIISNPFDEFKIASHAPLEGLRRSVCPRCKASRMYFCYSCFCYVEGVDQSLLPKVKVNANKFILLLMLTVQTTICKAYFTFLIKRQKETIEKTY